MSLPWIILDRDGVINVDSDDYIKSPEEWHPIPGSLEAIAKLKKAGYFVGIATNQSGIARGYYSKATLADMHKKMADGLAQYQVELDAIAYCPHGPDAGCCCRKPQIGLLQQLAQQSQRPLSEAILVGDTLKDIQAAQAAGCQPVLVKTGKGERTLKQDPTLVNQIHVYASLAAFVNSVI